MKRVVGKRVVRGFSLAVVCLAGALALAACSSSPDWPAPANLGSDEALSAYLDEHLAAELDRSGIVGFSVSVVDGGDIVYARGFGRADREGGIAATPVTDYRMGSLSKPFTSALVMQLVDAGKVQLDEPLATYLPEFAIQSRFDDPGPVTVRKLLTHRGGIPNLWHRPGPDGRPVRFDELVADMRGTWLTHPPGSVTKYSSQGYNLLGALVEAVTDRTFEDFARTSLLEPIGARTASFSVDPADHPGLARAYRNNEPVADLPALDGQIPSGGLHANVVDLARFMRLFLERGVVDGRRVLGEAQIDSMMVPAPELPLDFDDRPGLAWFHTTVPGLNRVGPVLVHGGSTFLYHSRLLMHPGTGVGVAVCTNTSNGRDAVERIANGMLAATLSRHGDVSVPAARGGSSRPTPVDHFEPFAGLYQTQMGVVDVDPSGGEAKLLGKSFKLRPEHGRWMSLEYVILGSIRVSGPDLAGLRFTFTDVEGTAVILVDDRGRETRLGERVEPAPATEAWRARVGKYDLVNGGDAAVMFARSPHLRLRVEGDSLVLAFHPAIHPFVELTWLASPVSDDEAVLAGVSSYLGGETLSAVRGPEGGERLRFWGYEFAPVR